MNDIKDKYEITDKLDFRNNKKQLINSYWLRLVGLLFFGILFFAITKWQNNQITIQTLFNLEIEGLHGAFSILFLFFDIVFVLYFHELIHAAVFYITHGQKPQIGMKGFVIFAAAPEQILTKSQLIINALAPFLVISIIGITLMFVIPVQYLGWIFIPTLINAAAAGGDFMTVFFVNKYPDSFRYNDVGDILNVLKPQKDA